MGTKKSEVQRSPERRGGRHRISAGTVRMVRGGEAGWLLEPLNHPATNVGRYVGRVGALAVALGIGGAIAGLPAAAADTGTETADAAAGSAADSAQSSQTSQASPGRSETSTRAPRSTRRGGVDQRDTAAPADAPADVEAAAATESAVGHRRAGRVATRVGGAESPGQPGGDSIAPAPSAAVSAGIAPEPAVTLSGPAARIAAQTPSTAVQSVPAAASATAAASAPQIAAAVTAADADVPVMTAAVSQAGIAGADPLEWLGGRGGTDVPAAAPLIWAAAAVSRRELAAPAPVVAPAAAVSTGQTTDPTAWLSDRIAGIDILAGLPRVIRVGIADAAAVWVQQTFGTSALSGAATLISVLEGDLSGAEVVAGVGDALSGWWAGAQVTDRIGALVGSVADDFLGAPGIAEALADAVETLATAADPGAALSGALRTLVERDAVGDAIAGTVSGALGSLVAEADDVLAALSGTVSDLVADLTGNAALGEEVAGQLVRFATSVLPDVAQIGSVGDAVSQWWAEAEIGDRLGGLLDSVAADFLSAPGVSEALAVAAGQVASAADPVAALPQALRALLGAEAVRDAVDATLSGALDSVLGDVAPVVGELGATLSGWVAELNSNSSLTDWVGGVLPGLLGQPGVADVLSDVAGQFATAVLTGADPGDAVTAAWRSLTSDPDMQAALGVAVSDAVATLLGDADLLQTAVAVVSDVVAQVLDDADLGAWAGAVLPGFLGEPGVPGALAGVAEQLVSGLLAGTGLSDAALAAWEELQSDPDIQAAVAVVMSTAVGGLLGDPEVMLYVRSAVTSVVTEFVGDAGLVAQTADQLVPLVFSVLMDGPVAVDEFEEPITALLVDWIVAADPGSADLAPMVAAAGFAVLRAGLLGDFAAVPATIQALVTDAAVLATLSERIIASDALAGLSADVRAALGEAATNFIAQSLGSAAVAEALTAVFEAVDFPSGSTEVADYLTGLLGSGFDLTGAVGGLFGPEVPAALSAFLTDPAVVGALGAATAEVVGTLAAAVLGDSALPSLGSLGDTVSELLSEVAGSALVSFLGQPGIGDALAGGAVNAILTALGGEPLPGSGSVLDALDLAVTGAVTALLTDSGLAGSLDTLVTDLVGALAGDPGVRALAGAQITALVVSLVGDGAVAADLAPALSSAVLALLAEPAVAEGLGAVTGAVLSGFLGQPEAVAALAGVAGDVVTALVSGSDPSDVLQDALAALRSDPDLLAGLGATVTIVLDTVDTELLGNAAVQEALGATVGVLLADLADNPAIRAVIEEQLGAALGPAFTGLLDEVIVVAGPLVTDLLGYPGISSALTGTADQIVSAVLAGTALSAAVRDAVSALQSDPAVLGALDALISDLLDLVSTTDSLRDEISTAANEVVSELLARSGLNILGLNSVAGQVAEVAIGSLLASPAFGGLITDIAADVLGGTAVSDVLDIVIDSVLRDGALQAALGTAIGQGIGSLFGDNVIGAVIGGVAGAAATLLIGVVAGFTLLFGGRPSAAAAAGDGLLDPAAAYVVTVTVPDWQDLAAAV